MILNLAKQQICAATLGRLYAWESTTPDYEGAVLGYVKDQGYCIRMHNTTNQLIKSRLKGLDTIAYKVPQLAVTAGDKLGMPKAIMLGNGLYGSDVYHITQTHLGHMRACIQAVWGGRGLRHIQATLLLMGGGSGYPYVRISTHMCTHWRQMVDKRELDQPSART